MSLNKKIANFEIEAQEEIGRVIIQYKNTDIVTRIWKEFLYYPNVISEFNNINTLEDVQKFFNHAQNQYTEVVM